MTLKRFYLVTFIFSVLILFLNAGLGIFVFGIFILPVLVLHFVNGLRSESLNENRRTVIFSIINLLAFALIRPDGVHVTNGNGLSSLLEILGFSGGYNSYYESYYYFAALLLLIIQFILEIKLRKAIKKSSRKR